MPTWTLLHMHNPLVTSGLPAGDIGVIGELSVASSRQLTFNGSDPDTLSFNMPGNHLLTSQIEPLESDVLVFRDSVAVQRYRVTGRTLSKGTGSLSAGFSGISYRGLLSARILRSTDTRSWASTTLNDAAWTLVSQNQAHNVASAMGIARGHQPTANPTVTDLTSTGDFASAGAEQFFPAGLTVAEAINQLADRADGFEWDIVPSPTNPYTDLLFQVWSKAEGGRGGTATSSFLLDQGGALASWDHTVAASEFGNVGDAFSSVADFDNTVPDAGEVWVPSTKAPAAVAPSTTDPRGAWERVLTLQDANSSVTVAQQAADALATLRDLYAEIGVTLARGRWQGPSQLWLGDHARVLITEPVTDSPGDYIVYIDEVAQVSDISIAVDDLGAEDVTLGLNRPRFNATKDFHSLTDRVSRLERR